MNKNIIGSIIGVILIVIALFPANIPNIIPTPNPKPTINLDVEKPTQDIIDLVTPLNDLITDPEDRVNLAVFNYVFSKRIGSYDIDVQKLNDLYVLAGENFFGDSINGKYKDLYLKIQELFEHSLGSENHVLSADEKVSLKNTFGGLSWRMIK